MVCPVLTDSGRKPVKSQKVYAAIAKDEKKRMYSTSGGIFPLLAEYMIKNGGYVAGAVYDDHLLVKHILTQKKHGLFKMRQSKYVQSTSGYIYRKVEQRLKQGNSVLFSGTPCQVEALYLYLGKKNYSGSLITCEVICIGAPCPDFYRSYLKNMEKKYHSIAKRVWFKNKEQGWNQLLTRIDFKSGAVYRGGKDGDDYIKAYRKSGFILRKCCYNCRFKNIERHSDITLGDFWNLKGTRFQDNKGISLVLLNSTKGFELFEQIEFGILKEKRLLKEAMGNEGLLHNSPYTYKTELYRRLFGKIPFSLLLKLTDFLG